MARIKSTAPAIKGANQLLEPSAELSPRLQHVRDVLANNQVKKLVKKRRAKQAQAARARRFA